MENISAKLSSKNQITVPKTVRDYLGVSENSSVQFVFESGRVYLEKGIDMQVCPFCYGEDFYGEPCLFCKGEGMVETITKETLSNLLVYLFIEKGVGFGIELGDGEAGDGKFYGPIFSFLTIETDDMQLKRYREHLQMESIKLTLREFKVKDLLDRELQAKLANMLEFEESRKIFIRWWDTLIDTHTK